MNKKLFIKARFNYFVDAVINILNSSYWDYETSGTGNHCDSDIMAEYLKTLGNFDFNRISDEVTKLILNSLSDIEFKEDSDRVKEMAFFIAGELAEKITNCNRDYNETVTFLIN